MKHLAIKKHFILILGCVVLTTLSCKNNKTYKSESKVIHFDLESDVIDIHKTGVIDSLKIINLGSCTEIIGSIDKVINFRNLLYIKDEKSASVHIFKINGEYITTISKKGNGPDEYINLSDIYMDIRDNTLNIISNFEKKNLKYSLDGSMFRENFSWPKRFSNISQFKNGYVGFSGNVIDDNQNPYNLWIMDDSIQINNKFMEIDLRNNSKTLKPKQYFSEYNNNLFFSQSYDYNLYRIDKDSISVSCTIDFGKFNLPENERFWVDDRTRWMRYIEHFNFIQETENFVILTFNVKGQIRLGIYYKTTKESCVAGLVANTDKYFCAFGQIVGMDEKNIYTYVSADRMKYFAVGRDEYNDFEKKYPLQVKNLRDEIGVDIEPDGNPFLLIYTIK